MCVFVLCSGVLTHMKGSLPHRDPSASREEDFKFLSSESQAMAVLTCRPPSISLSQSSLWLTGERRPLALSFLIESLICLYIECKRG